MSERDPGRPIRLRLLDLSTGIAGGYGAKLLGDIGADVVKLEPPAGDPLRAQRPLLFEYLHGGHRSAIADLATEEGVAKVHHLAVTADIVLESFEPGVVERLELPARTLVSISPFGRGGPWSNRAANEWTLQAWCGSLEGRGIPGEPPVGAGGDIGEFMAGSAAAAAALTVWFGGGGQHVDVSMFEAMALSFTSYQPIFAQFDERPYGRSIEIPSIEPALDGWVGFCTITRQQWSDFTVLIGRPDLGDDDSLAFAGGRMARREEVRAAIAAWTSTRTVAEIVEQASLFRIPVSPVGNGRTVTEMDHMVERGVYVRHPAGFLQPRRPFRLGPFPDPPLANAPRPGEHDAEIAAADAAVLPPVEATGRPLEGLRVVAFVAFWAGPFVASYCAALGADVIKIESIQRPDGMRFGGGVKLDDPLFYEYSGVSHGANVGVRAITLDLDRDEGRDLALRLVATADIVVENFSPRVLDGFGLSEDVLREAKPDLVFARMPAFGLDGPWRDRGGFAMTIEQTSGLAWRTGYPDGQPLVPRGPCDVLGALHTIVAVIGALEHRRRTGEGLLVEVPLVEAALNIAAEQVLEWSANGVLLEREGNRSRHAAPQGVYRCADDDRYVVISVHHDEEWDALLGLLDDAALAAIRDRHAAHDDIDAAIERWLAAQHCEDAVERLATAGVPAAPTLDARRINHLPQVDARGWLEPHEHPVAGTVLYEGLPMTFSAMPRPVFRRPAPTLGEHNGEVLFELGVTPEELAVLEATQIVGTRPVWMT